LLSSISAAATTLKLPDETFVFGSLEVTFFKLVPKNDELGTEATAPELFKLNCNIIVLAYQTQLHTSDTDTLTPIII
jgi:hypothetical protein